MSTVGSSTGMRRIDIRLFAAARERAGEESVQIAVPNQAVIGDVRRILANEVPALAEQSAYLLFAINNEYVKDDDPIPENCELAAFPPVSGG